MLSAGTVRLDLNSGSDRTHRSSVTILLVDDEPTVLTVLRAVLTHAGYRVLAAASPALAIEIAAENPFDMLITDFQMPELNGFTLACHLTRDRIALPVVMVSGSEPMELPLLEIAQRRWEFMPKPIDRERLIRTIDSECLGCVPQRRA